MNSKVKTFIKVICFVIITVFTLWIVQDIVKYKNLSEGTAIINGFYEEEKNDIEVLVMGSSNSFCTIDPVALYENYGIAAYDFGSPFQTMNITYLYVQEALKRQNPKVIALEVYMMQGGAIELGGETCKTLGYTDIPFSIDKVINVYDFVGGMNSEFWSYVFPLLGQHNRWKEISKLDFQYHFGDKVNQDKGFNRSSNVSETAVNLSGYKCEGESWVADSNIFYLDKICKLCQEQGVELLLFKSPNCEWYSYDTEALRKIAKERGLSYIDYNEIISEEPDVLSIDCSTDFGDGAHLNQYGAKKVTMHLGQYLKENYVLTDRRTLKENNSWDKAVNYHQRLEEQPFMEAQSGQECWDQLMALDDYMMIITKKENSKIVQWVYDEKILIMNKKWSDNGVEHIQLGDKDVVFTKNGQINQLLIDGEEYFENGAKWSFIVYDKITKEVVANLHYNF